MNRIAIASVVLLSALGIGASAMAQQISSEEQQLALKVKAAPDAPAKLKAAGDFLKKFPKSTLRPDVAAVLIDSINAVTDATQRLNLALEYQKLFGGDSEAETAASLLIDAYVAARQFDQAFDTGSQFLAKDPDALRILVSLASIGTEQAKQRNAKYAAPARKYGTHAIELIEANKKPISMNDEAWKQYQGPVLASLYQSTGILLIAQGDRPAAKLRFEKGIALTPADAFNYLMLGGLINDEYQATASRWKGMPAGPAKEAELQKALALLDQGIDSFAHFVALSEGNEKLQSARQQYSEDLQTYYKYRHQGSIEGLQQLIDKYKRPPK